MSVEIEKAASPAEQGGDTGDRKISVAAESFKAYFSSLEAKDFIDRVYEALYAPQDPERGAEYKRKIASNFLAIVEIMEEAARRHAALPSFERDAAVQVPQKTIEESQKLLSELTHALRELRVVSTQEEVSVLINCELEAFLKTTFGDNRSKYEAAKKALTSMEAKILGGVWLSQESGAAQEEDQKDRSLESPVYTSLDQLANDLNLQLLLSDANWDITRISKLPIFVQWRGKLASLLANLSFGPVSSKSAANRWGKNFVERISKRLNETQQETIQKRMQELIDALL